MNVTKFTIFIFCFVCKLGLCFSSGRPNIVLILTDDQDSTIGGVVPMRRMQDLIAKEGATFMNSFVATPVCCPSRSSLLTGMYPHNTKAINNTIAGGCSSPSWQKNMEPHTFASILNKEANYTTFYAGKYLNEYGFKDAGGLQHVPEGWSVWRGLFGNSRYYNFTLSHNGVPVVYTNGEYLTDVIKEMALEFVDQELAKGNPLLMVLSPPAPHSPFTPAPRHKGVFKNVRAMRTPNFNIVPEKDKHWIMQMPPSPLPDSAVDYLDEVYRSRWETLLAVDEMVEEVFKKFNSAGALQNTYFIFTSDNGYHIGQFSQPFDKRQPYETDIRVPLFIRGPGIKPKSLVNDPVINIDLAPTILTMAGLFPKNNMDGIPVPIFSSVGNLTDMLETNNVSYDSSYDRHMLIEYHGERNIDSVECPLGNPQDLYMCSPKTSCKCQDAKNNTYSCVRHLETSIDFIYCSFNDTKETEESYDMIDDLYQINNTISTLMPAIKFKYQNIMQHLLNCVGALCNEYHN